MGRLATNYTNTNFILNEQELEQFVTLFSKEKVQVTVKICDNGDRDVFIQDGTNEIQLPFRQAGSHYICDTSYVVKDLYVANVMRKAMKAFRGHGIVHRVYEGFSIVYHYDEGSVIRIEDTSSEENAIFENNSVDHVKELQELFSSTGSENEIIALREKTDKLLDLRNWAKQEAPSKLAILDKKLTVISRRLFQLEAY